jgi:hypothetical protein
VDLDLAADEDEMGAIPFCVDCTEVKFKNARKIFENIEEKFGILLFFAGVRHSRIEWIQH